MFSLSFFKRTYILRSSLLLCVLLFFLVPTIASAQIDPRCFSKAECASARANLGVPPDEQGKGFYDGTDATSRCGTKTGADGNQEQLGFCLPAGKTETSISFGGRDSFDNLGDFISFMYQYGVQIAGVVATVVIIISGLQWAISGGNTSTIDSAKKRISGAIVGLLLAVFAYTILNTLNPYLVNLRLPQIWLIKKQSLVAEYCDEAPTSTKMIFFDSKGVTLSKQKREELYRTADFSKAVLGKDAECGKEYFLEGENATSCTGIACKNNTVCFKSRPDKPANCDPGSLAGTISASQEIFCSELDGNIIDNNLKLIAMCKDGDLREIEDINVRNGAREYKFSTTGSTISSACSGDGGLAGFYIGAEINDESSLSGWACKGAVASTGNDDWFAIGRYPNSHNCSLNIAKIATEMITGEKPNCNQGENDKELCSCGAISDEPVVKFIANQTEFQKYLITKEELNKGFVCDINITRNEFPNIDQHTLSLLSLDQCQRYQDGFTLRTIQSSALTKYIKN